MSLVTHWPPVSEHKHSAVEEVMASIISVHTFAGRFFCPVSIDRPRGSLCFSCRPIRTPLRGNRATDLMSESLAQMLVTYLPTVQVVMGSISDHALQHQCAVLMHLQYELKYNPAFLQFSVSQTVLVEALCILYTACYYNKSKRLNCMCVGVTLQHGRKKGRNYERKLYKASALHVLILHLIQFTNPEYLQTLTDVAFDNQVTH